MELADFDYELPESLIAQHPAKDRDQCRLLDLSNRRADPVDRSFLQLPDLLQPGDLLVFNNTRVIPARMLGHKSTGGQVELLLERVLGRQRVLAQLRASKAPKIGQILHFSASEQSQTLQARVCGRQGAFFILEFVLAEQDQDVLGCFHRFGQMPLPPYIQRSATSVDAASYQTVYAVEEGAVAAPTAGLHFSQCLLDQLVQKGVQLGYLTLHVGAGTFQPLRTQNILEHKMHAERFVVSEALCEQIVATQARGQRVIAVGTTTVRALESVARAGRLQACTDETRLFIYPGFRFRVIDALLTNFHLPRSSLLIMLSAFAGREFILHSYQQAIARGYRFFSYGDAMFVAHHQAAPYNAIR